MAKFLSKIRAKFSKLKPKKKSSKKVSPEEDLKDLVEGYESVDPEKIKRADFLSVLIKTGIYALSAVVLVVVTFVMEAQLASSGEISAETVFKDLNFSAENIVPEHGLFRFSEDRVHDFQLLEDKAGYLWDVKEGHMWGNLSVSAAKTQFLIDKKLMLIPDNAVFDLDFDGDTLELSVFDGDVYVGFVTKDTLDFRITDQFDERFGNTLLVPRESKVTIPLAKVDQRIDALLYSKLVKEFRLAAISDSVKDSDWVVENMRRDSEYIAQQKAEYRSEVVKRGLQVGDGFGEKFIFGIQKGFTFTENNREEVFLDRGYGIFDDAVFYAVTSDSKSMENKIRDYDLFIQATPVFDENHDILDRKVDDLFIFSVDDMEYEVFVHFAAGRSLFWSDVYDGLNQGDAFAEEALNRYLETYKLGDAGKDDKGRQVLTFENQLFDNLFLKYPVFYRDGYFAIKYEYEKALLDSYEDGRLKDELKQAFISNKIRLIKRNMKFFFDGDVDLRDAKEITARLIEEVNDLMPNDSTAAVIELFESELDNIADFWGYLNSTEYSESRHYGQTHKERFDSYIKERDTILSIQSVQEEILGGDSVDSVSMDDVVSEVEDYFAAISDVSEFEVVELRDAQQRYVDVKGVIGGYPFEAEFDRDQLVLNNVYTYGEIVTDQPVKLSRLLSLLKERFSEVTEDGFSDEEEFTEETLAQRAARAFIKRRLEEMGFVIELDAISVVDENNAVYRVEDTFVEGQTNIVVTFDLVMNGEIVRNLFVRIDGDPLALTEEYSLDQLLMIIKAEGDFEMVLEDAEQEELDENDFGGKVVR